MKLNYFYYLCNMYKMLKQEFDCAIAQFNNMKYFMTDPIAVVKKCKSKKDIEIMGIVCSWLALGNRDQIFKKCNYAYDLMEGKPYEFLLSKKWTIYKNSRVNFYRIFFFEDFYDLMNSLYSIYFKYNDLEEAVNSYVNNENEGYSYLEALIALLKARGIPKDTKSACKRLSLFLRWMIRKDGIVDLGIWKTMSQTELLIPLDVHVNRVARSHGLIQRKASDMKTVLELTLECQKYYPDDPAIMDFALFGLGYTSK